MAQQTQNNEYTQMREKSERIQNDESFLQQLHNLVEKTGQGKERVDEILRDMDGQLQDPMNESFNKLLKCPDNSIKEAVVNIASKGGSPNHKLGYGYLIPRWSGKDQSTIATGVIGVREQERRVMETGMVSSIVTQPVYEGDEIEVEQGASPNVRHKQKITSDSQGPETPIASYSIINMKDKSEPIVVFKRANEVDYSSKSFMDVATQFKLAAERAALREFCHTKMHLCTNTDMRKGLEDVVQLEQESNQITETPNEEQSQGVSVEPAKVEQDQDLPDTQQRQQTESVEKNVSRDHNEQGTAQEAGTQATPDASMNRDTQEQSQGTGAQEEVPLWRKQIEESLSCTLNDDQRGKMQKVADNIDRLAPEKLEVHKQRLQELKDEMTTAISRAKNAFGEMKNACQQGQVSKDEVEETYNDIITLSKDHEFTKKVQETMDEKLNNSEEQTNSEATTMKA